jgi:transposase
MMGRKEPPQENLFIYGISLENRVRVDHALRKVKQLIDFDFIYKEVEDTYGDNGNVSVPPPVILKLMFLFMFYNVRSERELIETLPERLDWLWFLGYTLTSPVPNHTVLSKARRRWGDEVFKGFFERIVTQCQKAGLIDGTRIFMDSSLIDADASNSSVVDTLREGYRQFEERLGGGVNSRFVSTTDPDASIIRQGGSPKLRYKTHRVVDGPHEIITAVKVTPGAMNEGHEMASLIDTHEANTGRKVDTVIADSHYGTKENLLICHDKGIEPHMPAIKALYENTSSRKGIFPEDRFTYHKDTDTCICPAGKILKKAAVHKQNIEYRASKEDCASCPLRPECTRSGGPRGIQRSVRKDELDHMMSIAMSEKAKKNLKTRQHLMERSFARSTRFRFDRARWRGLWKVAIQEYLVCVIQNIQALIRHGGKTMEAVT